MATTVQIYNHFGLGKLDGTFELDVDPLRIALLTSAYVFDAEHNEFADVVAAEVAAGNGYTTGGVALTGVVASRAAGVGRLSANPAQWLNLTKTFRFAVLYASKSVNGLVNPLIACFLIDNTPADIVVAATDYSLRWPGNLVLTTQPL